jgi:hypothetical protein
MNREKQIEEMAKIIGHCESTLHPVIECHNKATGCYCIENPCHNQRIADKLYNAGYRKQSEGEWVHDINNLYGCSNCLARETMSHKKLKPFCPNCGAKMEGGDTDA